MRAFAFPNSGALLALAIAVASSGCSSSADTSSAQVVSPDTKLQITDTKVGTGVSPKPGQICVVHYTGWIYENGVKGAKFDSSVDRKQPFSFTLGEHKVIDGWEQGVATMKVGGKRTLIVPPALGYGSQGNGSTIPANATLLFEVELLKVKAPV